MFDLNGAPGGSRTPDQQDRNLLLYPAELLAHIAQPLKDIGLLRGSGMIRVLTLRFKAQSRAFRWLQITYFGYLSNRC